MTEQPGTASRLTGAVQDLASEVVSVLRGGDHSGVVAGTGAADGSKLGLAAVRVLGADVLLPSVLLGLRPHAADLAALRQAVAAYPPGRDASPASRWSHWAMTGTLLRLAGPDGPGPDTAPGAEPGTDRLDDAPWQALTHRLALLASLAVPGADSALAQVARRRPVDVARGFVRAVRRRDWLQAAGAGRWLALLDGVPPTLGLGSGLDFVALMGGQDARVALHTQAARLLLPRAGVPA